MESYWGLFINPLIYKRNKTSKEFFYKDSLSATMLPTEHKKRNSRHGMNIFQFSEQKMFSVSD